MLTPILNSSCSNNSCGICNCIPLSFRHRKSAEGGNSTDPCGSWRFWTGSCELSAFFFSSYGNADFKLKVVLAQYAGAEIFATCSSEAKRDLLIEQYGIPTDHILSSRDASFATSIMAITNGKGVDVVLNSLSGALLKETWDCVARFGRFIEVGKIDLEAARRLDMTPFRQCVTFASVDIMQLREYNRPLVHRAISEGVRISHERFVFYFNFFQSSLYRE